MRGKFLLQMMLALFLLPSVTANAAKTDIYRDTILSKHFTLKYTVENPPVYQTNNSAYLGFSGMSNNASAGIYSTPHGGIIVVDGDNRYNEVFHDDYETVFKMRNAYVTSKADEMQASSLTVKKGGACNLIKNGEEFTFMWDMKNDKKRYFGSWRLFGRTRSVKANDSKYQMAYKSLIQEYSFGAYEVTNAMLPLLPPNKILDLPGVPHYEFLGSGSLDNGLTYEDFVSDDSNMFSAVRYYFDGDDMKRIASASYIKKDGEVEGYTKSVIDQSYLSLPAELKDKTKRDNKKDDEDDNESNGESEEDNEE